MGQKSFWVKKVFGSNKFLGQKSLGKFFFGTTEILCQKIFGLKKFVQKSFLSKKIWSNIFGGQKGFFDQKHPDPKLKNNWCPLSSTFHVGRPETLTDWKSESLTDGPMDRQTWKGATDACASKNLSS